ncbi:MAG TPA: hypothetical protein VEI01_17760 [Terriglobales bacterium]|nr:hypothetical protein [Terriglobales bacterium]
MEDTASYPPFALAAGLALAAVGERTRAGEPADVGVTVMNWVGGRALSVSSEEATSRSAGIVAVFLALPARAWERAALPHIWCKAGCDLVSAV